MITPLERMITRPEAAVSVPSALERMLKDKERMAQIRQKYNMKDLKNMKAPKMQWEGDDHS